MARLLRNAGVVAATAVMAAGIAALSGCSGGEEQAQARTPMQMPPVPVLAAKVVRQDVRRQVSALGVVEAYSTVSVTSQVSAQVMRVAFEPGQAVTKGQVLFELDARPFQAALHQAQATLAKDQALADTAKREASRLEELWHKNAATKYEYEQAQNKAQATQATLVADKAAIEAAQLQLNYCTIRSPIDGRAGDVLVHEGNVIKANDAPMVVINQVQPIYVDFAVPEKYLEQVRMLMHSGVLKVSVTVPNSGMAPVSGRLSFLDNKVDRATGMIVLKATFDNAGGQLWPGRYVNAHISLATLQGAIVVPNAAIQTGQDGSYVYVITDDGTVKNQPIKAGVESGGVTVIQSGLTPGQTIVTDGQLRLRPGSKVVIKKSLAEAAAKAAGGSGGATTRPATQAVTQPGDA